MQAGAVTVVGLGSGDADQLHLGVWRKLQEAEHRFVRTEKHPMMRLFIRACTITSRIVRWHFRRAGFVPGVYDAILGADPKTAASGQASP